MRIQQPMEIAPQRILESRHSLEGRLSPRGPMRTRMSVTRWHFSSAIAFVGAGACIVTACASRAPVSNSLLSAYRGDGTISEIKFAPYPGVEVRFEPFPLSRPFSVVYRIDGLPKRPSPYSIELVATEPRELRTIRSGEPIRIGVPGTLKLAARRVTGEVIFECEWSPEERGWSIGSAGAAAGFLDHIHERPRTGACQRF